MKEHLVVTIDPSHAPNDKSNTATTIELSPELTIEPPPAPSTKPNHHMHHQPATICINNQTVACTNAQTIYTFRDKTFSLTNEDTRIVS